MKPFSTLMLGLVAWILPCTGSAIAAQSDGMAPREVSAARLSSDALIMTGGFNRVSSAANGGVTSLDWVHLTSSGKTYAAGAEVHSVGDSHWGFAKLSSPLIKRDRIELRISADIGGGKTVGERFSYQIYEAGTSYQAARRLYLTLNEQYLRIGDAHGHLIKPGAMILLTPRLRTELSFAHSIEGNIKTQFGAGRLELAARQADIFGGIVIGHTSPEILRVRLGNETPGHALRQAFLGIRFRFQEVEWTVAADFPDLVTNRQQTLTVGMRIPLRRNRQDSQ